MSILCDFKCFIYALFSELGETSRKKSFRPTMDAQKKFEYFLIRSLLSCPLVINFFRMSRRVPRIVNFGIPTVFMCPPSDVLTNWVDNDEIKYRLFCVQIYGHHLRFEGRKIFEGFGVFFYSFANKWSCKLKCICLDVM
jgi:hypothetical protein